MKSRYYVFLSIVWTACVNALSSSQNPGPFESRVYPVENTEPHYDSLQMPYSTSKLTSAVIKVSYDGTRFFGWKATNEGMPISHDSSDNNSSNFFYDPRHRSRRGHRLSSSTDRQPTIVRSVVGVLKKTLAKVYGDVDISRIQVEGSSRTDRGVHAHGMIALIYCLTDDIVVDNDALITPKKPDDDTFFRPLPFHGNLDKLIFVLNRMLTPDVRIMDASPLPYVKQNNLFLSHSFHPSIDALSKTYQYTLSIGNIHDPTRCRLVSSSKPSFLVLTFVIC